MAPSSRSSTRRTKAEIVEIFGQYWTEKIEALGNPEAVEMLNKIIEMKG